MFLHSLLIIFKNPIAFKYNQKMLICFLKASRRTFEMMIAGSPVARLHSCIIRTGMLMSG